MTQSDRLANAQAIGKDFRITVKPDPAAPHTSEADAVRAAWGDGSPHSKQIVTAHVLITGGIPTIYGGRIKGTPRSLPVWMVMFFGVREPPPSSGPARLSTSPPPPPRLLTESFTVIVDDRTGKVVADNFGGTSNPTPINSGRKWQDPLPHGRRG